MKIELPQAKGARIAAYAVAGIVALIAIGAVLWFVFVRPRALQTQAASSRIEAAGSAATAGAARDTVKLQVEHSRQIVAIEVQTKEGEHAVHSAQGANVASPDVAAAMRAALCVSGSHRADPACSAVRGSGGSVGDVEPDTGRAAPR
ncbi:hypothetical protein [Sphingomonas alpina]|uniref:Uncharacterized protein n=1 Tax=Sphingomonas alpina TaxID=653931 RepID=A0A7H0LHT2_9SPHN|nr:hypothetical protein [Sphingomonas alpina]QNQ09235.1 hypothetical protein H3Z74_21615 [Sphingomonas alpina]